jgi:spermidine synthase
MTGLTLHSQLWFAEFITPYDIYQHGVREVLAYQKTPYQEMYIVDSGPYGKALVLDGLWQSSSTDEFLYHEPLVHPAMVNHGRPGQVLILGAGEGATLREVLKWHTVERAVMVDLDQAVVSACRRHLAEVHQGSFDDPRAELVITDAWDYLAGPTGQWDVIISDLSDPIEEGPSFKLFTQEYFEKCRQALKAEGYFVVQAGSVAPVDMAMHIRLVKTVQAVFPNVVSYHSAIPTFAAPWGFILGSQAPIAGLPEVAAVDALLQQRTTGQFRMFDGTTLLGLMQSPKHIRQAIATETRRYTLADPPKFS